MTFLRLTTPWGTTFHLNADYLMKIEPYGQTENTWISVPQHKNGGILVKEGIGEILAHIPQG